MAFLNLTASITRRALITANTLAESAVLAPFAHLDNINGIIAVEQETGDPTNPTQDVPVDSATLVALTNGSGTIYATGSGLAITNVNQVGFTMLVDSVELQAALAAAAADTEKPTDYIEAFLECRITKDSQDFLLLREPTLIFAATAVP
jgi:hypothetical protein